MARAQKTPRQMKKNKHPFWGLGSPSLTEKSLREKPGAEDKCAYVRVVSQSRSQIPKDWLFAFQAAHANSKNQSLKVADTSQGLLLLVNPQLIQDSEREASLKASAFTRCQVAMGQVLAHLEKNEITWARFDFEVSDEDLKGCLTGLELSLYRFKKIYFQQPFTLGLALYRKGQVLKKDYLNDALSLGCAINLARHLTNLPPNLLNPVSYAEFLKEYFSKRKSLTVEVWDEKRLQKENCGLHLAVGNGSNSPPRLVHFRYRPQAKTKTKSAPIALVGKGITFDSGGLDIKPSSGMRLMKKDMGGSAAVVGVLDWALRTNMDQPLDVYVALAENSISDKSFRPSDVIQARNGLSVEIHNTDAEGRLVLADALDVAITSQEKPKVVIDVATLTGAIKVALGSQLAGLFSNQPRLAQELVKAGQKKGDYLWAMPLVQKYRAPSQSNFADMVNATDGFGGAITAALFLEKFVGETPWLHLDIYAWKDAPEGAFLEAGGSGQAVAALAEFIGTN